MSGSLLVSGGGYCVVWFFVGIWWSVLRCLVFLLVSGGHPLENMISLVLVSKLDMLCHIDKTFFIELTLPSFDKLRCQDFYLRDITT